MLQFFAIKYLPMLKFLSQFRSWINYVNLLRGRIKKGAAQLHILCYDTLDFFKSDRIPSGVDLRLYYLWKNIFILCFLRIKLKKAKMYRFILLFFITNMLCHVTSGSSHGHNHHAADEDPFHSILEQLGLNATLNQTLNLTHVNNLLTRLRLYNCSHAAKHKVNQHGYGF